MMTKSKQRQLLNALKQYHKIYLKKLNPNLDESGTRIMINSFLTDVLGFTPIEEVKTEYMIRGTYADYVVQLKGKQHFLVEAKKLGLDLSEKHLRQAIGYGAGEGIDFAMLTNGKQIDFYRIILVQQKPIKIAERLIFSVDLSDLSKLKQTAEKIQYLHKSSVINKGLDLLWGKCIALDPKTVAGLLHNKPVLNFIKGALKKKFKKKFTDIEVGQSLNRIICEAFQLDEIKQTTVRKKKSSGTGRVTKKSPELIQCLQF